MLNLKYRFHLILSVVLFLTADLSAQINADSILMTAIEQSRRNDYENALLNARKVLNADPLRCDVNVFVANLYAWQKNFDSSKVYIKKAYKIDPGNSELYDTWLNILLWNKEFDELLRTTHIAVSNGYSDYYNILLKQLSACKNTGSYSEADEILSKRENEPFLDSIPVINLYREILLLKKHDILTAYYSLDYLPANDPAAQHLAFIDYAFRIRQNSLIVRLNYANRFNRNDLQPEADYYLIMKNSRYIYLNYGYSFSGDLFPRHHAGFEYYLSLKNDYEASLGARYLYFTNNHAGMITASVSRYIKSTLISIRPFVVFSKPGNSVSFVADIRRYMKLPLSYWNLEFGYGNSPDERFILNQTENYYQLDSYRMKLSKNIVIGRINELKLSLGYAYEEYKTDDFINRYTFEAIFRYRLK